MRAKGSFGGKGVLAAVVMLHGTRSAPTLYPDPKREAVSGRAFAVPWLCTAVLGIRAGVMCDGTSRLRSRAATNLLRRGERWLQGGSGQLIRPV